MSNMSKIDPHIFFNILIYMLGLHTATYYFAYSAYSAYCNMSNMSKIDPFVLFYILVNVLYLYVQCKMQCLLLICRICRSIWQIICQVLHLYAWCGSIPYSTYQSYWTHVVSCTDPALRWCTVAPFISLIMSATGNPYQSHMILSLRLGLCHKLTTSVIA